MFTDKENQCSPRSLRKFSVLTSDVVIGTYIYVESGSIINIYRISQNFPTRPCSEAWSIWRSDPPVSHFKGLDSPKGDHL